MYTSLYPLTYYFYPLLSKDICESSSKGDFLQQWERDCNSKVDSLLYVHIPYCHDMCRFCPFHVRVDSSDEIYTRYTNALIKEIELLSERPSIQSRSFKAIYFGGGSPSIFSLKNIDRIFVAINQFFKLTSDVEISFEGEPKTLGNKDLLSLLESHNVSRISFGVQTYDPELRKHFNINATLDDISRCNDNAKQYNFKDINVDMMYDLPGQNISLLMYDLEQLYNQDYDSIDYYNLHYYAFPKKFKTAMLNNEIPPKPTEEMHFALYDQIRSELSKNSYHNVADQIFSKSHEVCEYFRILWGGGAGQHNAETIAVGSSARGYINGYSYMNLANVNKYLTAIEAGEIPFEKISEKLKHPSNRGAFFMMKFLGIINNDESIATIDQHILNNWHKHGLIYYSQNGVHLSEKGKLWTVNMMVDVFEPEQSDIADVALSNLTGKQGTRTGTF